MGLFVLLIIGIVVAQTWYDWRKNSKDWALPEWVRGAALGGVLAVSIAGLSSFAAGWIQDPHPQLSGMLESHTLWPQVGLVAVSATVILLMARKRRLPWLLLLGGMVFAAFWIGTVLGS